MPKFEGDVSQLIIENAGNDPQALINEMLEGHAAFRGTAEQVTSFLQGIDPNYKFEVGSEEQQAERKARRENAQKAIIDSSSKMISPMAMKGHAEFGGKDREKGRLFGHYVENFMPEKVQEFNEICAMPEGADRMKRKADFRYEVYKHLADHADSYVEHLENLKPDELMQEWPKYRMMLRMGDIGGHWGKDSREFTEFAGKIEPMLGVLAMKDQEMDFYASPLSEVADYDQIRNFSNEQLYKAKAGIEQFFEESQTKYKWNVFSNIISGDTMIPGMVTSKQNREQGNYVFDRSYFMSTEGKMLTKEEARDEMVAKGRPIYTMSVEHPDKGAQLAFVKNGKAYLGNDALRMFADAPMTAPQKPKEVDPNRKPSGFGAFWDNLCKNLGLQALRTASAKAYEADVAKYEADLAEYNKSEAHMKSLYLNADKLNTPEKLKEVQEKIFRSEIGESGKSIDQFIAEQKEVNRRDEAERAKNTADKQAEFEKQYLGLKEQEEFGAKVDELPIEDEMKKKLKDTKSVMQKVREDRVMRLTHKEVLDPELKARTVACEIECFLFEKMAEKTFEIVKNGGEMPEEMKNLLDVPQGKNFASVMKAKFEKQIMTLAENESLGRKVGAMLDSEVKDMLPKYDNEKSRNAAKNVLDKLDFEPAEKARVEKTMSFDKKTDKQNDKQVKAPVKA